MDIGKIGELQVTDEEIDQLYEESISHTQPTNNQYFILNSGTRTTLARYSENKLHKVSKNLRFSGLEPRDAAQKAFVDSLTRPDILLTTCLGQAGTGKTSLALAWALEQMGNGKRLILTKPATWVGSAKGFGTVPGSVEEKYGPFLASYKIVLRDLLGDKADTYIEMMIAKKQIEYVPIEYARGCTFKHCTLILDEAQNTTWHEFSSLVSRVGEGSKTIVLGDLSQIDIKLRQEETGLYRFCHSRNQSRSTLTSVVQLTKQYRSPLTQLICEVDGEIRANNTNT